MSEKLGKTGNYPLGKECPHDEGELNLVIGLNPYTRTVVVEFGTSVKWIGMSQAQAKTVGDKLLELAALNIINGGKNAH